MRTRTRTSGPVSGELEGGIQYVDLTYPYLDGSGYHYYGPLSKGNIGGTLYCSREQTTDELHSGPPWRTGGPFDSIKWNTDQYEPIGKFNAEGWKYGYWGNFYPQVWPSNYLSYSFDCIDDIVDDGWGDPSNQGASAWNRFRPTRSGSDLGVTLGEITEIPRMLKTTALGFRDMWKAAVRTGRQAGWNPRKISNHWLNTQFGWLPFVGEMRSLYNTQKSLDKSLKQLRRDNGRWVRRRGIYDRSKSENIVSEVTTYAGMWPALVTYIYQSVGGYKVTVVDESTTWFSGAFRYWIPGKPDSWQWNARATAMLFGLTPSPSLLYELTPWSWLLDWFTDYGDAVANMSSMLTDNLCAKYAYLMSHRKQEATYHGWQHVGRKGWMDHKWTASIERKIRVAASPFGFGLTGDDFSARQWSILTALGLTRRGR